MMLDNELFDLSYCCFFPFIKDSEHFYTIRLDLFSCYYPGGLLFLAEMAMA